MTSVNDRSAEAQRANVVEQPLAWQAEQVSWPTVDAIGSAADTEAVARRGHSGSSKRAVVIAYPRKAMRACTALRLGGER